MREVSCCGNTVKPRDTKGALETCSWPGEKNRGMVISRWMSFVRNEIGNPHAYSLKTPWKVHGRASETERKSVGDDGQSTLNLLKIQSTLRSKGGDIVIATNLQFTNQITNIHSTFQKQRCNLLLKRATETSQKKSLLLVGKDRQWPGGQTVVDQQLINLKQVAGFFDGDGSVFITLNAKNHTPIYNSKRIKFQKSHTCAFET